MSTLFLNAPWSRFATAAKVLFLIMALCFGMLISAQNEPSLRIGNNDSLGAFVVAANGMTLYTFDNDGQGVSNCAGACTDSWPAYIVDANTNLSAAPNIEGTISSISRADGSTQVTLDGKPLYFFINDTAPQEANGNGSGGVWHVFPVEHSILQVATTEEAVQPTEVPVVAPTEAPAPTTAAPSTDNNAADSAFVQAGSNAELGVFLTAANGMTVYTFSNDTDGVSNCVAQCAELWPPLLIESAADLPVFVDSIGGVLSFIERSDATFQLTFNNRPLYFYAEDSAVGDTTGQGVGNVWFVVNLDTLHSRVDENLGNLLVAGNGMSLYTFTNDTVGVSNCVAQCAETWPPLTVPSADTLPAVDASIAGEFATIARADGAFQVTFNGWPLYFFGEDKQAGDVNGQGVGNVWFAVSLDALRVVNNATLGDIIVSSNGMSLYTFANDEPNWSNCVGDCAVSWPPLTVSSADNLLLPSSLEASISTTERADGSLQLSFNGRPLYFFSGDTLAGETNGHGRGEVWSAVLVEAAVSTSGNAELGSFVAGSNGMTVYTFANDTEGTSNCVDNCAVTWPPLTIEAGRAPIGAAGISQTLGTIQRADGSFQVTLDGKPLYFFSNDVVPSNANGQGAGGVWYVFALDIPFDPASLPATCVLTPLANGVNLRSGVGTEFETVAQANAGENLIAVGQTQGADGFTWYKLSTGSWVRADVVNVDAACAALPILEN